ncbi:hypothetical protein ABK040_005787 [Willaertia magna]
MSNCIFCKIIRGELPVSKVFESESVMAFMDIQPVNYGHILIVPKVHAESMNAMYEKSNSDNENKELMEKAVSEMFPTALKINKVLRELCDEGKIRLEGVNLFLADGEAAGQEVFHVHLHVFPRFKGDGFKMGIKYPTKPTREELNDLAQLVSSKL